MANQLGMAEQQSILVLARRGWSQRRIARALGIHRETVARYIGLSQAGAAGAGRRPAFSRTKDHSDDCGLTLPAPYDAVALVGHRAVPAEADAAAPRTARALDDHGDQAMFR